MHNHRLAQLAERQRGADIACVALVPGPNMRYVSGLPLFMSERPIVAFFPTTGRPAVLLPFLEKGRAEEITGGSVDFFSYSDEKGPKEAFARAADALFLTGKRCAIEYLYMRALELRFLEAAAPDASFVSLEETIPGLRIVKDAEEVEAMRRAIDMTERALETLISRPLIGLSEREIAGRLRQEFMQAGADTIGFVIVVSGPNGADPHKGPSDRPVQAGEFLTIDCGIVLDGYFSDITRTFALGAVSEKLVHMYEVVRQSNAAGKAAVGQGVTAQDVDRAARKVIVDAGYGKYFFHRTGHGLGIEGHEPPYIVEGNDLNLEPGMVFTVEPGIYIPELGGVRIEDDVVVTEAGVESLTTFSRELTTIS
jgi:Xaa-Pro dipeptidase